jgi:hypothetical protein
MVYPEERFDGLTELVDCRSPRSLKIRAAARHSRFSEALPRQAFQGVISTLLMTIA